MHFVWLLTIVLLPLATALISNEHVHWADCFYILLLAVSILALIGITREVSGARSSSSTTLGRSATWPTGPGWAASSHF